jgi:hypothetical protein
MISQGEDPFSLPQSTLQKGALHNGCPHGIAYREICEWIPKTRGVKHYSPGESMTDCRLNVNNLQLSFGVYCQVAENVEPRNSLALRTRAAIFLGNSGKGLQSKSSCHFFRKFWQDSSLAELRKSGW